MKFGSILSFAALYIGAVQAAAVNVGSDNNALSPNTILKRGESATHLLRREAGVEAALKTIFNGLDGLTDTVGARLDDLLGTFFAGDINAQDAADAIATLLNDSQSFGDAVATILKALKS